MATRDHTERMLAAFGAAIETTVGEDGVRTITIDGGGDLQPQKIVVPGDPSSAAFPIVAALIVEGSDVTVENVLLNPTRTGLIETLLEMGADIAIDNRRDGRAARRSATCGSAASGLKGVAVPAGAGAVDDRRISGPRRRRRLRRGRDADGGDRRTAGQGIRPDRRRWSPASRPTASPSRRGRNSLVGARRRPRRPAAATVATHLDHRIAMSFLVLGLASEKPVTIDDAAPIATSFPAFRDMMTGLGAQFEDVDVD